MSTTHRPRLLIAIIVCSLSSASAFAQTDPLPSWNEGAAKPAIVKFVQDTTTQGQLDVRAVGGAYPGAP